MSEIKERDTMTKEQFEAKRDELLENWEVSKVALESAKSNEMAFRKAFVDFAFDSSKTSGTQTIELNNGFKAKVVKKINYNLNQETVNQALDAIENVGGAEGKVIAERLVKWKADLSLTEYKLLDPKYKALIDKAITTSEGSPSLEIVEPKDTKKL